MEIQLTTFASYWGAWLATVGTIWVLFSRAETIANEDLKLQVKRWLNLIATEDSKVITWQKSFIGIFDAVFGDKHLSWKCFRRSCLASFVAVGICFLLWMTLRTDHFLARFSAPELGIIIGQVLGIFLLGLIINFIPDYLSLLETRYLLSWMQEREGKFSIVMLLIVDLLVTASIILLPLLTILFGGAILMGQIRAEDFIALLPEIGVKLLFSVFKIIVLVDPPTHTRENSFVSIFFYSTFATSVWLWLYLLSGVVARLMMRGISLLMWMKKLLAINEKPFLSLGTIAIMIISVFFLLGAPIVLVTK